MPELEGWTLENDKSFNMACPKSGGKEVLAKPDSFYVEDLGLSAATG
jgi:hypothetical protein